ncbi:MAG: D-ribulokinase [Chloroflexota bacterium]|jgi:sugar (pentulose or hexulose) kinase|nr:D-ribulokinase [Chloroflexota bacterium]
MSGTVGIDVGSGGVRAVMLDDRLRVLGREERALPPGSRSAGGGHRLDESVLVETARAVLDGLCRRLGERPEAVAVCGTAGTLCLHDGAGLPAAAAVAYDDHRHGTGLERVSAWHRQVPRAHRVLAVADAVLEALGAEPGATDWTNALRLGWDPVTQSWPAGAAPLRRAGLLPEAVPPGTPAGRVTVPGAARGARLVRGTTDGCALELAAGGLEQGGGGCPPEGRWTLSLGTTVTWRSVVPGDAPELRLPPGAYLHRLRDDVWLVSAAGNSGGGVLRALEPGADLADLDARSRVPTGLAAYPLARPGERFPVADPRFPGFGLPAADDPRLHAAILEGTALVVRLGIDRLCAGGAAPPRRLRVSGGGARSPLWMRLLASAVGRPVTAVPDAEPALGMALLAAAAVSGAAPGALTAAGGDPAETEHPPDPELADALEEPYAALVAGVLRWERRAAPG